MITIIGAGKAGSGLGRALSRIGEKVFFGVSNVKKYEQTVKAMGPNISLGTVQEALNIPSEIVILAIPYPAVFQIASTFPDWGNRILIDISTPWRPDLSGLSIGLDDSAAETIARAAKNARVVKAFNSIGAECFENPSIVNGKIFMPVCSDDAEAKNEVMRIGSSIGFEAVDAGPLRNARATEPLVSLWLQLSFMLPKGRTFEFGLLNKEFQQ